MGLIRERAKESFYGEILFQTNDSLKVLNLAWNGLAFVGALAFTRHLKKNETLAELDIRFVENLVAFFLEDYC